MKTDYLWDKTGEDAEIERLENALASFRYRAATTNDAAIVSPLQTAKVEPRAGRFSFGREFSPRIFSYKFALAASACAAFLLIGFAVRLRISSDKINVADQHAAVVAPVENASQTAESIRVNPNDSPFKNFETDAKSAGRKIVGGKIDSRRQPVAASFSRRRKVSPIEKAPAKIQFTDEELYAYNQLKLALSIASSKLKLVRDKAESAQENDAGSENGR